MIEGRIAQILSESLVVINVGATAGAKNGMLFVILAEGDEVKDPETGESLGRWEVPKGHLCVVNAQERLSVCEAVAPPGQEEKPQDPSTRTLSAAMIAVSMPGQQAGRLSVRRADISGMPEIPPVRVGDKVRALPEAT